MNESYRWTSNKKRERKKSDKEKHNNAYMTKKRGKNEDRTTNKMGKDLRTKVKEGTSGGKREGRKKGKTSECVNGKKQERCRETNKTGKLLRNNER